MNSLKGKVSLVTGGSRGIGEATALALAEEGSDVAITYQSSQEQAENVCVRLRAKGVRAEAYQADAASDEAITAMTARVLETFGPVHILVNNAGISRDKSFLKMSKATWDEVLRVNLNGLFYTTQAVLPGMIAAEWGRIVNVSSIIGQTGNFGQTNYAVAKGGIISFTKSLAREVARKGVTVNAVAPGFIATDMLKDMPDAALEKVEAMTPMGRLGRPEEIADAILYLARPQASYVTGHVLAVNGGMYM